MNTSRCWSESVDGFEHECWRESARLGRHGPSQWVGFGLSQTPPTGTRKQPLARALTGVLFDRAVHHAVMSGQEPAREPGHSPWSETLCCWRSGERVRRFVDLARDVQQDRLDHHSFVSLSHAQGAAPLTRRHVNALEDVLEHSAQRRNLGRLLAHADRLAHLLNTEEGVSVLCAADDVLDARWGVSRLLTWCVLSRFCPIRFQQRRLTTMCVIELLYMKSRDLASYTGLSTSSLRGLRVDLTRAIRALNDAMSWHTIQHGIPERLAMTQGDLKKRHEDHDDDDNSPPLTPSLEAQIKALAARNGRRDGDEALWSMLSASPALWRLYCEHRGHIEDALDAQYLEDMGYNVQPRSSYTAQSAPSLGERMYAWITRHVVKGMVLATVLVMLAMCWGLIAPDVYQRTSHHGLTREYGAIKCVEGLPCWNKPVHFVTSGRMTANAPYRLRVRVYDMRVELRQTTQPFVSWSVRSACKITPKADEKARLLEIENVPGCTSFLTLHVPKGGEFDVHLTRGIFVIPPKKKSTATMMTKPMFEATRLDLMVVSGNISIKQARLDRLNIRGNRLDVWLDRVDIKTTRMELGIAYTNIHGRLHDTAIYLLKGSIYAQFPRDLIKGRFRGVVAAGPVTVTTFERPVDFSLSTVLGDVHLRDAKAVRAGKLVRVPFRSTPNAPFKVDVQVGVGHIHINE